MSEQIRLNFLELDSAEFSFQVYRRRISRFSEDSPVTRQYDLPEGNSRQLKRFEVSLDPLPEFEDFCASSTDNIWLTNWFIYGKMNQFLVKSGLRIRPENGKFRIRLNVILEEHDQGYKEITIEPYFLQSHSRFGILVDYRFKSKEPENFSREVQRLSLSLDSNYRSNKNFIADKYRLISTFFKINRDSLMELFFDEDRRVRLAQSLTKINTRELNERDFIFRNNSHAASTWNGIIEFGPFRPIVDSKHFVFVFKEQLRSFANELFLSLLGKLSPGTFPGMEKVFRTPFSKEFVSKFAILDYSEIEIDKAIDFITKVALDTRTEVMALYIEDFGKTDDVARSYYYFKYQCIERGIPLQVVDYSVTGKRDGLKWSSSNIGLQIFAKLGGVPWRINSTGSKCLIIGLGAAHAFDKNSGETKRHFSYCVCLDSSGAFHEIEVLSTMDAEDSHLHQLRRRLVEVLQGSNYSDYQNCVLHIPSKIKTREIEAIRAAIHEVRHMRFVVLKINEKSKFYGYSFHNSMVPQQGSFVQIAKNEFLLWIDGINKKAAFVGKRPENPLHVDFLHIDEGADDHQEFLQQLVNLSGANWRGFNSNSQPISLHYSKLVSKFIAAFRMQNLPLEEIHFTSKPWFL